MCMITYLCTYIINPPKAFNMEAAFCLEKAIAVLISLNMEHEDTTA